MTADGITLNKFLADRGVASRRHSAQLVKDGRVRVNGEEVREPGTRIDPAGDVIALDGQPLPQVVEKRRTLLLHKPRGFVCSTRGQGSQTVYELIPRCVERLVPVGRLDKDSEGLLLMSNDGDLVDQLTHPRHGQTKVYRVTVSGTLSPKTLSHLGQPMRIDGQTTAPAEVTVLKPGAKEDRHILQFVLREGKKRQIRRMCEQVDLRVHRLVRTAVGTLRLRRLASGAWRELTARELAQLLSSP